MGASFPTMGASFPTMGASFPTMPFQQWENPFQQWEHHFQQWEHPFQQWEHPFQQCLSNTGSILSKNGSWGICVVRCLVFLFVYKLSKKGLHTKARVWLCDVLWLYIDCTWPIYKIILLLIVVVVHKLTDIDRPKMNGIKFRFSKKNNQLLLTLYV